MSTTDVFTSVAYTCILLELIITDSHMTSFEGFYIIESVMIVTEALENSSK